MEQQVSLPIEVLEKIAAAACTAEKYCRCYCYGGIFGDDSQCTCDRAIYENVTGLATLAAFSATCRRFRRLRPTRAHADMLRRRILYLHSMIDMCVKFTTLNNLVALSAAANGYIDQRVARRGPKKTASFHACIGEISRQYERACRDSPYSERHCPSMIGKKMSLYFRPIFCKCERPEQIVVPKPWIVYWCSRCHFAISTSETDKTISAEW